MPVAPKGVQYQVNYRSEIDGLRALAVIPVILFHAGFELFSGGFIGVDVFFVISGYLITSILIKEIQQKRFSLMHFYERRARRILPALIVVILFSIPFAIIFMNIRQLNAYFDSVIGITLFSSNFIFLLQSNYFADAAENAPLLHTWSLSVEEQFYIIFPLFLIIAHRTKGHSLLLMLIATSILSFSISEWGWRNQAVANFYLAPTRAWELLSGSIAAVITNKYGAKGNQFLSILGLFLILISIFLFDSGTPFPSMYTLLPVTGAVLVILYGNKDTFAARLLSIRFIVFIGLISYSTYLWHQPLFAFARLSSPVEPSPILMLMLSVFSLVIGYLSWTFIELPFRNRNYLRQKHIFFLSIGSIAILSIGILALRDPIMNWKFGQNVLKLNALTDDANSFVWTKKRQIHNKEFLEGKFKLLVVGDSMSGDLINTFDYVFDLDVVDMSSITIHAGCGALYIDPARYQKFVHKDRIQKCQSTDSLFDARSQRLIENADWVIFASSWSTWELAFLGESSRNLEDRFGPKFSWLGKKGVNFPSDTDLNKSRGIVPEFANTRTDDQILNAEMTIILGDRFIDPYLYLCEDFGCRLLGEHGELLRQDSSHLTKLGAKFFADRIIEIGSFGRLSISTYSK